MDTYDAKSCSALEKPYYRPIEAALRWCNLTAQEAEILRITGTSLLPPAQAFPQWPCLRANAEKIHDAIQNNELTKGRQGRPISPGESVAIEKITVRHTELKEWMAKHYPDQKPAFLFDEVERNTHANYNASTFTALQADRDALKARVDKAEEWEKAMIAEKSDLQGQIASLAAQTKEADPIDTRERNTLLTIIAALCKEANIDYTKPAKAAGLIQSTAAKMGVSIGETTIEGHLKKIPDALATRMK